MLTIPLQYFLNDKNIFHINFTCSLTFQWKLIVMAKHGELFQKQNFGLCPTTCYSTLPIRCTQTQIHRTQSLHYDKSLKCSSLRHISLQQTSLQQYIAAIYHFALISLQRSLARMISRRDEDCTDISLIYCFNVQQPIQCFADTLAINRENKAQYL